MARDVNYEDVGVNVVDVDPWKEKRVYPSQSS